LKLKIIIHSDFSIKVNSRKILSLSVHKETFFEK